jgi:hypothetical protein
VLAAWELYELGGDVDLVRGVVNRLAAAAAYVVFVPAVAVELVLFASMSEVCSISIDSTRSLERVHEIEPASAVDCYPGLDASQSPLVAKLTILHALIILHPRPHQPTHQTLRYTRPDPEIQVRPVRTPE